MTDARTQPAATTPRCPICRETVDREASAFPFCSERCRLIDLGRWLGGRYVIPSRSGTIFEADPDE